MVQAAAPVTCCDHLGSHPPEILLQPSRDVTKPSNRIIWKKTILRVKETLQIHPPLCLRADLWAEASTSGKYITAHQDYH